MHKQRYILLAALLAAGISQSFAQSTYPDTSARAKEFANQNKILQGGIDQLAGRQPSREPECQARGPDTQGDDAAAERGPLQGHG